MAYTPTTWVDNETAITATRLNNIETEIEAIADGAYTFAGDKTFSGDTKMTGYLEIERNYPTLDLDALTTTDSYIYFGAEGTHHVSLWYNISQDLLVITDYGVASRIIFDMATGDITRVGDINPVGAGTENLGNATNYWGDVSYKTLTDRGCLGSFDLGVELLDGSIVSDIEALKAIKKHPTLKTVYGVPRLDYKTMPKSVYKAPDGEKLSEQKKRLNKEFKEAESDEEKARINEERNRTNNWIKERGADGLAGDEGAETTALLSIVIGAIKELDGRVAAIEG